MYGFQAVLGVIPDLFWTPEGYKPSQPGYSALKAVSAETPWLPVVKGSEGTTLRLNVETIPPDNAFTLILSIGIRFGALTAFESIAQESCLIKQDAFYTAQ